MRPWIAALLCAGLVVAACAEPAPKAPPQPQTLMLWPGAIPDPLATPGPETTRTGTKLLLGKTVTGVDNVSTPSMTIYPAKGANTGAAMIVFPGGGYRSLAIDLEGTEVCDVFTAKGITCVVLKYRVPGSGPWWDDACKCHHIDVPPRALQDAQRALGLLRLHAAEWGIDPHKVGVVGFSAGGHMVAQVSTHFTRRAYTPVDAADQLSARPDFAIALYPGHIWGDEYPGKINRDIIDNITADTPPTFLLQNEDDPVDDIRNSRTYDEGLKAKGVPVEYHTYPKGGHAFGVRPSDGPASHWPDLATAWLRSLKMIP